MLITLTNVQKIGTFLDLFGAVIIFVGVVISTGAVMWHFIRHWTGAKIYDGYRKDLARSILLGLELLVAGDIIRTVTGQINVLSVLALAGIVAIRSFLGAEFEMELTGRWPWQSKTTHKKSNYTKTRSKKK